MANLNINDSINFGLVCYRHEFLKLKKIKTLKQITIAFGKAGIVVSDATKNRADYLNLKFSIIGDEFMADLMETFPNLNKITLIYNKNVYVDMDDFFYDMEETFGFEVTDTTVEFVHQDGNHQLWQRPMEIETTVFEI